MVDYSHTIVYKITAPNGKFIVDYTTSKITRHREQLQRLASCITGGDERVKFIRESGGYHAVKIVRIKRINVTCGVEAMAAVDEVRKEMSDTLNKKSIQNPLDHKQPAKLLDSLPCEDSSIRWPCGMCRTNKCLHIKEPSTENVFTEDYVLRLVDEHQGNNY